MTENEFQALSRAGYNRIPVQLETLADLDTPLSIFLKLANRRDSYLLESVIGGERFGRYSIVGLPARATSSMLSVLMPPSTSSQIGLPVVATAALMRLRTSAIYGSTEGMNCWPPNPGFTDISRTRSSFSSV